MHHKYSKALCTALVEARAFLLDPSLAMNSLRNLLCFVLGAATTAAFVVLLLPAAPCPYTIADLGLRKLNTVAAVSSRVHDSLAELLRKASMADKTIIITFTDEAVALPGSLLQNFLESFNIGVRTQPLLKHLLVVATDAKAFDRCRNMHTFCYPLLAAASDQPALARNRFQSWVLALGYGFVSTDVATLWFRNPLLRVPAGADVAVSCERFHGDNPYDLDKPAASGGLVYARPTPAAAAFLEGWYEAMKRHPGEREGLVFDRVKHQLAATHGATVLLLDTAYFAGHCEFRQNFHQVCTFQANCLDGMPEKMGRLAAVIDEWKQFKAEQLLLGANTTALTY